MPWRRMGNWRYSSTIFYLGTRWRWVVSFTSLPLYPRGCSLCYQLNRRLGAPQSRSGSNGEETNLASTENRTPAGGWLSRCLINSYLCVYKTDDGLKIWFVVPCFLTKFATFTFQYFFIPLPLFRKNNRRLMRSRRCLGVCVCLCISVSFLDNGSVKILLSLLGNGSVKIPLSLLGNDSVETLPR
jgi:hypothetical protein